MLERMNMFSLILCLVLLPGINGMCCYYRQHYHDAYCSNKNFYNPFIPQPDSFGCVLSRALIAGSPKVVCSSSDGCMPLENDQGYWLEGFRPNCDECAYMGLRQ